MTCYPATLAMIVVTAEKFMADHCHYTHDDDYDNILHTNNSNII